MKSSKVEKIVTIIWIAVLILAIGTALVNQEFLAQIFSITSWVALAAVIGVRVHNYKKS